MYVCMYEYTYAYVSSKKGAYLEFHRTDRSPESQWSKIRKKCNLGNSVALLSHFDKVLALSKSDFWT